MKKRNFIIKVLRYTSLLLFLLLAIIVAIKNDTSQLTSVDNQNKGRHSNKNVPFII